MRVVQLFLIILFFINFSVGLERNNFLYSNYEKFEFLGRGSFSLAFSGICKNTGVKYAFKSWILGEGETNSSRQLFKEDFYYHYHFLKKLSPNLKSHFLKEVKKSFQLDSQSTKYGIEMVHQYDFWTEELEMYSKNFKKEKFIVGFIRMELCDGTLSDFIAKYKDQLDEEKLLRISYMIAKNLLNFHSSKTFHGDINSGNLLFFLKDGLSLHKRIIQFNDVGLSSLESFSDLDIVNPINKTTRILSDVKRTVELISNVVFKDYPEISKEVTETSVTNQIRDASYCKLDEDCIFSFTTKLFKKLIERIEMIFKRKKYSFISFYDEELLTVVKSLNKRIMEQEKRIMEQEKRIMEQDDKILLLENSIKSLQSKIKSLQSKIYFRTKSLKGRFHKNNEDRFISLYRHYDDFSIFGVFDGHGSSEISQFIKNNFHNFFVGCFASEKMKSEEKCNDIESMTKYALDSSIKRINQNMKSKGLNGGSTGSIVILSRDTIYIANVGDSRVMFLNSKEEIKKVSTTHNTKFDMDRLKKLNESCGIVNSRVFKKGYDYSLAMTRAFGDFDLFPCVVINPTIASFQRNSVKRVLIASDGTSDELGDYVLSDFNYDDNKIFPSSDDLTFILIEL